MDFNKRVPNKSIEIRCFNIIGNRKDKHFGEKCNRLLLCKNSDNQVAGEIKCPRCHASYEIIDGLIKITNRGDKRQ